MEKVLNGQKITRTTTVQDDTVTCHHVTKHDKLGNVSITWGFNFEGVEHAEILKLAARSLLIDARREFKPLAEEVASGWDNKKFFVREMLDATRKTADPISKAKALFDKMTDEQRADLLAQFEG